MYNKTIIGIILLLISICDGYYINNNQPRLDTTGKIMDAHDGSIQQFTPGGPYYIHAIEYGLCKEPAGEGCSDAAEGNCGFRLDHNITIYKSYTMESGTWQYVGSAITLSARPPGVLFRSHCVYNPVTKLYVLWVNYGEGSTYTIMTATSPEGPFTVVNKRASIIGGDFDILVDSDGAGYLLGGNNQNMLLYKLSSDYHDTASTTPIYKFPSYWVEAPAFFKRKGIYYALYAWSCCFCTQGSGIQVWTSEKPGGPYTQQNINGTTDLACTTKGTPSPDTRDGCEYHDPKTTSITRSQQNFVVRVSNSTLGVEYIWTGDRWQQAPDGLKGHEPQYWVPLVFNDKTNPPSIQTVSWEDTIHW